MSDTSIAQLGLGAAVSVAFHPVTYAKILIQLGHEPLSPVASTSIFGRPMLVYPNVFKYIGHIRSRDGFTGMYRGLTSRLCAGIIGSSVNTQVTKYLKKQTGASSKEIDEDDDAIEALKEMAKSTCIEMTSRCTAMVISHPFHVIMVRSMAQYVGEETQYSSFFGSIGEIYSRHGVLGFFAGLVPRLVGEVVTVWLTNTLIHIINQYLLTTNDLKSFKAYSSTICTLMVTQITYPFSLVSNVMAVCDSGIQAGRFPNMPSYSDWTQCFKALKADGQIKRGSSIFFRYYKGPVSVYRHDGKPVQVSSAFTPPAFS